MVEQLLTRPKTIFLNPKEILRRVGLKSGQHVVDLGCGGGYFVLEAAREVGDDGLVVGVDILQSVLSALASRARMYGLYNIRTVWSNAEVHGGAHQIKDHSVDVVLMIQLLSQSRKHQDIFKEATRMAKDTGMILVVDWRPDHGYRFGPPPSACLNEKTIITIAGQYGWHSEKTFAAGPYHLSMILKK